MSPTALKPQEKYSPTLPDKKFIPSPSHCPHSPFTTPVHLVIISCISLQLFFSHLRPHLLIFLPIPPVVLHLFFSLVSTHSSSSLHHPPSASLPSTQLLFFSLYFSLVISALFSSLTFHPSSALSFLFALGLEYQFPAHLVLSFLSYSSPLPCHLPTNQRRLIVTLTTVSFSFCSSAYFPLSLPLSQFLLSCIFISSLSSQPTLTILLSLVICPSSSINDSHVTYEYKQKIKCRR